MSPSSDSGIITVSFLSCQYPYVKGSVAYDNG